MSMGFLGSEEIWGLMGSLVSVGQLGILVILEQMGKMESKGCEGNEEILGPMGS